MSTPIFIHYHISYYSPYNVTEDLVSVSGNSSGFRLGLLVPTVTIADTLKGCPLTLSRTCYQSRYQNPLHFVWILGSFVTQLSYE